MMVIKSFLNKKVCVFYLIDKMKFSILYILILIIWGCSNSSPYLPEKPADLLSEKKFKSVFSEMILNEMILNEMIVQSKITSPKLVNKKMSDLGNGILKRKGVDSLQYIESFNYYSADKDKMEQIYNEIIDNFKNEKQKLN
jgi:hypothetical protein